MNPIEDPVPTSEELAEFDPRIRRLARRLVVDPNDAEDLAQDGWVRALRHPPAHGRALGAWMKRIVRSAAVTHFHRRARQDSANLRSAEPEGSACTPEQALERREIARDVRAALDELGAPYSRILKLRFLDDLSAREIAAREGLPVETVRTQIKRGLGRMRDSLDRRWGDRGSWFLACLTWSRESTPATSGVGLTLLIGAASLCIAWLTFSSSARPVASTLEPAAVLADVPPGIERSPSEPSRIAMEGPATVAVTSRSALLRVRVRSTGSGEPVPGLLVRAEHVGRLDGARPSLRTDDQGELVLSDLAPGTWRIVPARGSPRLVGLDAGSEQKVVLVVDDGLRVDGTVVLPDGAPAAEAEVCATFPGSTTEEEVVALTDEQGRFELVGLDRFAWIHARHPSFRATTMRIAADVARRGAPLTLELRSPSTLRACVVDAEGRPVAGARVQVLPVKPIVPEFDHTGVLSCQPPNPSGWTGPDGTVELRGLLLRHSLVHVQCDGYLEARLQLNLVAARKNQVAEEQIRCVLRPSNKADETVAQDGAWIHGVVEDDLGSALPGRLVVALPALSEPTEPLAALAPRSLLRLETVSGEEGTFHLRVDGGGDQDLFVLPCDGGAERRSVTRVPGGSQGIVLRVSDEPGATVTGRVKMRVGEWSLVIMTSRESALPHFVEPDPEGGFRLELLAPGTWSVFLLRSDGLEPVGESVELRSGDAVDLATLEEPGRGAIELRITFKDAEAPANGVQAVLRGRDKTARLLNAVDSFDPAAVYSATDLPKGSYELECWAPGMRREHIELEVSPDRTTPVSVELVPSVQERVALQAVGHAKVTLVLRNYAWNEVDRVDVTLERGHGEGVLTADAGEYVLQVLDGEAVLRERPVTLGARGHAPLLLDLDGE